MIEELIAQHRVLIVGGSGGVGKTSLSAALGLAAARAGHRTLVLTIDPARRLAAALGLDGIGPDPEDLGPRLRDQGVVIDGQLHAMMLDVKNTLDRAVERYASSPQRQQEILANRLYRNISTRLSGSQEYAAMQRLTELVDDNHYERIILDTPPSTQALDFLTAPERLQAFFDSSLTRVFISFGGKAGRGFFKVTDVLFRALEKLTGANVIRDIAEFFQVAESILEPFGRQAGQAKALLRRPETSFVVVTGPREYQLEDAVSFQGRLRAMHIRVAGILVNRCLSVHLDESPPALPDQAQSALPPRVAYWASALERLAQDQDETIARARERSGLPVLALPELPSGLHAIDGLLTLEALLVRQAAGG